MGRVSSRLTGALSSAWTSSPGMVLVAIAAVCWGLAGGIGGMLMAQGWDPMLVSLYRGTIGLLFVLVWFASRPRDSGLSNPRLWYWSAIAGVGVAGNFALYFLSIAEGSVAVAATLMYSAPVFVYLSSFAFGLERPTPIKWAALAMAMIGIVLLTGIHDLEASDVTPGSAMAGILSGLCYAAFIFGFKNAARHGSPQAVLVIAFSLLTAILAVIVDLDQASAVFESPSWPLFLVMGVLGAGLSFVLYVIGLKRTAPPVAAIVAMVEPITASLFGVLVLNQGLVAPQLLGMAMILIAVAALSRFPSDGR